MKKGLPRSHAPRALERRREAHAMLYAGLDLSRKRLDFCLLDQAGKTVETGAAPPDADADAVKVIASRSRDTCPACRPDSRSATASSATCR
jgi:hypothetical protein